MAAEHRYDTARLAELIAARLEVLVQLRELARRQLEVIGEADMPRLFVLLSSKQTLLERMQRLDGELDPFRRQDPERRVWSSSAARQKARAESDRCESLLQEIMLIEKQGETELIRRRDEAATQLEGMHTAARARTAYAGGGSSRQGGRLDLTSET